MLAIMRYWRRIDKLEYKSELYGGAFMSHKDHIIIQGLCQNNLKNVSLEIPKEKIVVFTGVSGSGKSSIVFDTIAAEMARGN